MPGGSRGKKTRNGGGDTDEPIAYSDLYGTGCAIGFTPREVDELTFWEFAACIDGYNRANGADEMPEPMSGEEFDEAVANSKAITVH